MAEVNDGPSASNHEPATLVLPDDVNEKTMGVIVGEDGAGDGGDDSGSSGGESSSSGEESDDGDDDDGGGGGGRKRPITPDRAPAPPHGGLSAYERLRLERIARNNARLAELGFSEEMEEEKRRKTPHKKPRRATEARDRPRRRSLGRAAKSAVLDYSALDDAADAASRGRKGRGRKGSNGVGGAKRAKAEYTPVYEGEHDDVCFMCFGGGDLLCCDFCRRAYHLGCHLPPLTEIPEGLWKCQECAALSYVKRFKCGECKACTRDDCGECKHCLDKPKFGGPGRMKQSCVHKKCPNKRFAPPAKGVATPRSETRGRKGTASLSSPTAWSTGGASSTPRKRGRRGSAGGPAKVARKAGKRAKTPSPIVELQRRSPRRKSKVAPQSVEGRDRSLRMSLRRRREN